MPTGEFCKGTQNTCDPTDCPVEFCKWRDTVWVKQKLQKWAYNTNYEKPQTSDSASEKTP